MIINNLNDSLAVRQARRVKKLSTRHALEHSANNQGRIRVIGGQLLGEAGADMTWHGDALLDGNVFITLSLTVSGDTVIGGSVKITEQLEVTAETLLKGLTTLMDNFVVSSGGTITVDGDIPLEIRDGQILFSNGASITGTSGSGGGMLLSSAASYVQILTGLVAIASGPNRVTVTSTATAVTGPFVAQDEAYFPGAAPAPPGSTSNAWLDPSSGQLRRIVS